MHITTVLPRNIVRDYRKVFNKVKQSGKPILVVNRKKEPEVAIITASDLSILETAKTKLTAGNLLKAAKQAEDLLTKENIKLPRDLSSNLDHYLWDE